MRLIALRVSPINCQVALIIPDAAEPPPEWPTGRELVVGDSSAVYVSTF